MQQLNFQEDYSSQLPALRMLINLGYRYLSQEEVMELRYNRTNNVLLEPILKEQLAMFNEIRVSSTHTEKFTQSNIDEAVLRLKEIPLEQGYLTASEHIYELLTLGTTLDQTIEGNRREYTLQYIDWKHPENNVFPSCRGVSCRDNRWKNRIATRYCVVCQWHSLIGDRK